MTDISSTKTINAPKTVVWEVLSDFANIANWTSQVQTSYSIGDPVTGVGQGRHCDLSPAGAIDETITDYIPEQFLGISVHNVKKLPIASAVSTFTLEDAAGQATKVTMTSDPTFKGGPVGSLMKRLASGKLKSGLAELLGDLDVAAVAAAKARS